MENMKYSALLFIVLMLGCSQNIGSPYHLNEEESEVLASQQTRVLFAGPPNVSSPVGVAAAPTGEVYISCDENSSLSVDKNRGKIVKCVDSNGDGEADKFTDYVPHIDSPRSGCFVGGKLYMIHPPYLSVFEDSTGDGVADKSKVLIKGLGFDLSFRGADHTTNGVRMGIDGWLYIAVGDYGFYNAVGSDGTTLHLHGGGVVRVRPDGSEMEQYAYHTRNIYDVSVSPYLDLFTRDNTNDGKGWNTRLHHITSMADMGYPRLYKNFADEHMASLKDYGGGSGTGSLFLHEPGFPEKYNNTLFTCDFTTRKVYVNPLKAYEATFVVGQEVFFDTKDSAIDLDVDGNSNLYISTWKGGKYRYVKNVGEVYKLYYQGKTEKTFPDMKTISDKQLLLHLSSRSAVYRINAQREIINRGSKELFSTGLKKMASEVSLPLYVKVAAIFTLKQLEGVKANKGLLELNKDPSIREFTLRALADRSSQLRAVPSAVFVKALKDDNPRVRLQAVIGLARLNHTEAAVHLLPLVNNMPVIVSNGKVPKVPSEHQAIPHTVIQTLAKFKAYEVCLKALDDSNTRQAAIFALYKMSGEAQVVKAVILKASETTDEEVRVACLKVLFRLYQIDKPWDGKVWWTTRPDDRGPYYEPVLWKMSNVIQKSIETEFPKISANKVLFLLSNMRLNRLKPSQFALNIKHDPMMIVLEKSIIEAEDVAALIAGIQSEYYDLVVQVKAYDKLDIAKMSLEKIYDEKLKILQIWIEKKIKDEKIMSRQKDFIFEASSKNIYEHIMKVAQKEINTASRLSWKVLLNMAISPLTDEALRAKINESFKKVNQVEFFSAIGEMKLKQYIPLLQMGLKKDGKKTKRAAGNALTLLEKTKTSSSGKKVAELKYEEIVAALKKEKGDVKEGQALFMSTACIGCHATSKNQVQRGPFLGEVGGKFPQEYLVEAIIEPDKVVAQGFQTYTITMKDDTFHVGFITDDKDGITILRDIAGNVKKLKTANIKKKDQQAGSTMPPGLVNGLTMKQFASLVAYLQSLKVKH